MTPLGFEKTIMEEVEHIKKGIKKLAELVEYDFMDFLAGKDPIVQEWKGADKDWDGHTGNERDGE